MAQEIKKSAPSLMALKRILEGTSQFTGAMFFKSLVKNLALVLNVHGVWVTEYKKEENRLNALAFWLDGKYVEKYEYDVKGTPCEPVLGSDTVCHVPDRVIELYPEDPDLPPLDAVSYMGLVLKGEQNEVLGHLAMLDQKPMKEIPEVFLIFRIFASRAQAEMRRLQYENLLRQNKDKMTRLLNGTMDAIIELDTSMCITQANHAAFNHFDVEPEAFISQPLKTFMDDSSYKSILNTVSYLSKKSNQLTALRIQGYLTCLKASGKTFHADSTMSRYEYEKNEYYALYIRDVNEKLHMDEEIRKLTLETNLLKEKFRDELSAKIIGKSETLRKVFTQIDQVAPTDSTVLVLGETGTGKELIAREIHDKSLRKDKSFIAVNCAALPSDLIESELFGHVKGAFTGATENRDGRFLLADKGTLFLDEIGELPLPLQAKLLRVVQEGEFEPVGSSLTRKVDVRLIAATHRNLKEAVENKSFREDLYYRLNVFPVEVPALRERGMDIILLAEAFIEKYCRKHGKKSSRLNEVNRHELLKYSWPGNVRELQNIIERAVITSPEGSLVILIDKEGSVKKEEPQNLEAVFTYEEIREMEIRNLQLALKVTRGKVFGDNGAARLLGIPPTTLKSKLNKFGISSGTDL